MTTVLGGPGVACSRMRVRRLEAGELAGEERARTEAHLAGCERCQRARRELEAERRLLAAELPFEAFAAGVAEELATARRPRRRLPAVGLALAAGLVLVAAAPLVLRVASERSRLVGEGTPSFRTKGGGALSLYVREAGGARELHEGEAVPPGAALRVGLSPAGRRFAAVALVDRDGVALLHAGAADPGVLPGAFEWTAAGEGTLVLVLDDAPVDGAALAARLERGGLDAAAPRAAAEVVLRPLRAGAP